MTWRWAGRVLRHWAERLDPPVPVPLPPPVDAVAAHARVLVFAADTRAVSGEAKRHWVYAQLIHAYPQLVRRDLSLILEQQVQWVPRVLRVPPPKRYKAGHVPPPHVR